MFYIHNDIFKSGSIVRFGENKMRILHRVREDVDKTRLHEILQKHYPDCMDLTLFAEFGIALNFVDNKYTNARVFFYDKQGDILDNGVIDDEYWVFQLEYLNQ